MRVLSDGARGGLGRGLLEVGSGRLNRAAWDRLFSTEAGRRYGGKPGRDGKQAAETHGDHRCRTCRSVLAVEGDFGRRGPRKGTRIESETERHDDHGNGCTLTGPKYFLGTHRILLAMHPIKPPQTMPFRDLPSQRTP